MVYTADQLNKAIEEYMRQTLPTAPDIEEIWLFGSYAQGAPNEYSDIDLAIISPRFASDYPAAISTLSAAIWNIDAPIEIHGFTREDFDSETLGDEIKNTGKCLYKKSSSSPLIHQRPEQ
ncbi:MAG: nucleotidyltransferase domain-containing protein [Alicyclobacillus sp.]|nr:nucleotidyltransferase domain-containing protein [Alicyclobacillus sp.]